MYFNQVKGELVQEELIFDYPTENMLYGEDKSVDPLTVRTQVIKGKRLHIFLGILNAHSSSVVLFC